MLWRYSSDVAWLRYPALKFNIPKNPGIQWGYFRTTYPRWIFWIFGFQWACFSDNLSETSKLSLMQDFFKIPGFQWSDLKSLSVTKRKVYNKITTKICWKLFRWKFVPDKLSEKHSHWNPGNSIFQFGKNAFILDNCPKNTLTRTSKPKKSISDKLSGKHPHWNPGFLGMLNFGDGYLNHVTSLEWRHNMYRCVNPAPYYFRFRKNDFSWKCVGVTCFFFTESKSSSNLLSNGTNIFVFDQSKA